MRVLNVRHSKKENIIFRRRQCLNCKAYVSTIESANFGCNYLSADGALDDRPATFVNGKGWVDHAAA